jgi:hypothetical protein
MSDECRASVSGLCLQLLHGFPLCDESECELRPEASPEPTQEAVP